MHKNCIAFMCLVDGLLYKKKCEGGHWGKVWGGGKFILQTANSDHSITKCEYGEIADFVNAVMKLASSFIWKEQMDKFAKWIIKASYCM